MISIYQRGCLRNFLPDLAQETLENKENKKLNKINFEEVINKKLLIDNQQPISLNNKEVKTLRCMIDFYINQAALKSSFYFRTPRKIALISGAGIAGLTTSIVLAAKGFNVIIAERRDTFSRFNVINLNVETQFFLKTYGLLEEFEKSVAARIESHRIVHIKKDGSEELDLSDVSNLELNYNPFEPQHVDKLFSQDGIYSVRIGDLQTFLAKKALDAGVHLLGNVEVEALTYTSAGKVSNVQIKGKESLYNPMTVQPELFFVAEGAHSTTAEQLGAETIAVENECSGENWIFGNAEYSGKKSCVVSMIDSSEKSLKIANVIFNAKIGQINIAVTSEQALNIDRIEERILRTLQQALVLEGLSMKPLPLIACVKQPVHVINEKRVQFSRGNIFLIGDTAGRSSPLAGLGGTLGLTLIPRAIEQLLNDHKKCPHRLHRNFKRRSEDSISRWMKKSQAVKHICCSIFEKAQISTIRNELALTEESKDGK